MIAGDLEGLAERLVRAVLELWTSDAFVGLVRSAASNEEAARMFREFNARHFIGPIAEALPAPQPGLRAALASAQVVGLLMARLVVRLEPIASAEPEMLVAFYAPAVQRCLTGPLAVNQPRG